MKRIIRRLTKKEHVVGFRYGLEDMELGPDYIYSNQAKPRYLEGYQMVSMDVGKKRATMHSLNGRILYVSIYACK